MTPQAWYDYARQAIMREQSRDRLSRFVQINVTIGDSESQTLTIWDGLVTVKEEPSADQ